MNIAGEDELQFDGPLNAYHPVEIEMPSEMQHRFRMTVGRRIYALIGLSFLVELQFLKGRARLGGYDIHSVIQY